MRLNWGYINLFDLCLMAGVFGLLIVLWAS